MASNQPTFTGLEPEIQDISRQREMAKLLLQQGLAQNDMQGQMIGNRYVGASPWQGIAKVYSAYKGKELANEADRKQAELAKLIRAEGVRDITDYMSAIQGKEATPDVIPEGQTLRDDQGQMTMGAQAGTPAVGPDYNKALSIAMNSRNPMVQALGGSAIGEMTKTRELPEGGSLVRFNPQTNKYDTIGAGGPKQTELIRDYNFAITPAGGGFKGSFTDYDLMRRNASSQKINVQNALPFQEQIYTDTGKALIGDFNTLKSIPSQVKQLDRVAKLAPKSFAGSFADTKLQTVKFFNNNFGTNIAPEKVNTTEELRTVLFTNIMDNLKKMDASPSQEQQRIMQASLGNIGTDPAALPAVVNVYKQILLDKATEHNARVDQTLEKGFKYPYSIKVNLPEPEKPKGSVTTPNIGDVQNGWRFKGGNPAIPTSWERAQ